MLVLARHLNESIIIAKEVRVTVLRISPNRVELGVDAGPDVSVDREEVHLRKQAAGVIPGGEHRTQSTVLAPRRNWNR